MFLDWTARRQIAGKKYAAGRPTTRIHPAASSPGPGLKCSSPWTCRSIHVGILCFVLAAIPSSGSLNTCPTLSADGEGFIASRHPLLVSPVFQPPPHASSTKTILDSVWVVPPTPGRVSLGRSDRRAEPVRFAFGGSCSASWSAGTAWPNPPHRNGSRQRGRPQGCLTRVGQS